MIHNEKGFTTYFNYYLDYKRQEISNIISDNDTMFYSLITHWGEDRHDQEIIKKHLNTYQEVGRSAVMVLLYALISSDLPDVNDVLDLACGHGRVSRHLVKLWPKAKVSVADINKNGVDFCAEQFGTESIYLPDDLADFDFGKTFDVIWCGSLFTHYPPDTINRWISHMCKYLSPLGIFCYTQHGIEIAEYGFPVEGGDIEEYRKTGYGFVKLPGDPYQIGDGLTVAHPSAVIRDMSNIRDVKIIAYYQKMWVKHHDVVVLGKLPT